MYRGRGHDAFQPPGRGLDNQALARQPGGLPASQSLEPQIALGGNPLHHEADLIEMSRQHHPWLPMLTGLLCQYRTQAVPAELAERLQVILYEFSHRAFTARRAETFRKSL